MEKKILADFFRHFAKLLGSGTPIRDTLSICRKQNYMSGHEDLMDFLIQCLNSGKDFGESLEKLGFRGEYLNFVTRGESAGNLDETAAKLADVLASDCSSETCIQLAVPVQEAGKSSEADIIRMVNQWISDCVERHASDLHIIPVPGRDAVVKYRVNGVLEEAARISREILPMVTVRIKSMAALEVAERRLPQDGRIQIRVNGRECDLRIATLPTLLGEKITARFIQKTDVLIGLDKIDFSGRDFQAAMEMIGKPYGMIFVTGATGQGKSTTCYSLLQEYLKKGCNVVTVELPIEYVMSGATQIHVDPSIGLTPLAALRSAMRSDPDVIFISEFSDWLTIELAIKAAQTGHVVIGVFHAKSVLELLETLLSMEKLEPSLIANVLNGVISQALVRKLCDCKEKVKTAPGMAKKHKLGTVYQAKGCDKCLSSGYLGRVPVREVIVLSHELKEAFAAADRDRIKKLVTSSLHERALELVRDGVTSLEEVQRVFGVI
ncbi:MAG: ATPase, T2SS/T4P/T4SS family [Candidatus Wallbacteria bacterium]|nr:ATPase, T2SS/T4P/T4SS family [Candidatus Wallbacteria bacterium]